MIPHGKDVFSRLSEPYRSLEGPARAAALASVLGILLSFHLTELLHHVIGTDALLPVCSVSLSLSLSVCVVSFSTTKLGMNE